MSKISTYNYNKRTQKSEKPFFSSGVYARQGEEIESLLKRFRKTVDADGIMSELRSRRYFKKPSEIRSEKKREIEFRLKKEKIKADNPVRFKKKKKDYRGKKNKVEKGD